MREVKNIGDRKHPDYDIKLPLWNFLHASFRGGLGMQRKTGMSDIRSDSMKPTGYFAGLFKWEREDTADYNIRTAMTPYRPYARRIVKAFVNYVTKDDPDRQGVDAMGELIADVDLKGTPIKKFVRSVLARQRVLGTFNVLVDMPGKGDSEPVSRADEIALNMRPYCVAIAPQQVVDWEIDPLTGKYEWVIIEQTFTVNKLDEEHAKTVTRRTFWDAFEFQTVEQDGNEWKPIAYGTHPVGEVPLFRIEDSDVDDMPETPESWFFDLADMNRAIYNLESIDVVNFHYQCFGQLILPTSQRENTAVSGASNAWTETPEESGISRYIQTNGIEHENIEGKIKSLRMEMYRLAGLFHRTDSMEAETAEAKAWDRDEMNQFLAAFADTAEFIEREIFRIAGLWNGGGNEVTVEYDKMYEIADVEALVSAVLDVKSVGWTSETGRKELIKRMFHELLDGKINEKTMAVIDKEIDSSEERDPLLDNAFSRELPPDTDAVTVGSREPVTE